MTPARARPDTVSWSTDPLRAPKLFALGLLWLTLRPVAWVALRFERTLGVVFGLLIGGALAIVSLVAFALGLRSRVPRQPVAALPAGPRAGRLVGAKPAKRRRKAVNGRGAPIPWRRRLVHAAQPVDLFAVDLEGGDKVAQQALDEIVRRRWSRRQVIAWMRVKGARWHWTRVATPRDRDDVGPIGAPGVENAAPNGDAPYGNVPAAEAPAVDHSTADAQRVVRYEFGTLGRFLITMIVDGAPKPPVEMTIFYDGDGRVVAARAYCNRHF